MEDSIYMNAQSIHNEQNMQMMWKYLYEQVNAGYITDDEAECIGEEIMIYG